MRSLLALAIVCGVGGPALLGASVISGSHGPTGRPVFAPAPPLRQYVAERRLESRTERRGISGWLVARTELRDGRFTWQVIDEGGSGTIRRRVLRETLEKEAEVYRSGLARRGGLTPDNYAFSDPLPCARGWRVLLEPRRRDDMLIAGALEMTPAGDLVRLEGELVKRPSFWTRRVHLVREYARVGGRHVPVRLDLRADVRLVGPSTLTMTYTYLEIDGATVDATSPGAGTAGQGISR